MKRLVAVPARCRSAHGVFTERPLDGAADFPPPMDSLLRRFGGTDEQLARLRERPHARLFLTEVEPAAALDAAVAAREQALALAAEHDGVVVDLTVPRLVEGPVSRSAAHWVAVDVDASGLSTRGLETFGLPELRLDDVPPEAAAPAIAVMLGLAQRLLDEWPEHDPVGPAAVNLADIASAYDDPSTASERTTDLLIALHDDQLSLTLMGDPAADLFG